MDNRIDFPESEIDFSIVGLTGQDHDNYAAPGTYPRYDYWKIIVLSLLANQASENEPEEFRNGSFWFNLDDFSYKYNNGSNFSDLSNGIKIKSGSLQSWSDSINNNIDNIKLRSIFSGIAQNDSDVINIPKSIQDDINVNNKIYMYKNTIMLDPILLSFSEPCPVCIQLKGEAVLNSGDTFTIMIK